MSIIEFIEMMLTNNIPNELEYVMYLGYEENNEIKWDVRFIRRIWIRTEIK